ncbi:MAG: hypothetical protein AB7F79_02725 [Steroidobacteraceae bacterium]
MVVAQFIKTRVTSDIKRRVQSAAQHELMSESIWLKRLVTAALRSTQVTELTPVKRPLMSSRNVRLSVRLRVTDQRLLRERAAARGMAPATYVSVLVRAHLSNLAPLPKEELLALKRSIAELGAIGRNLNQMARASNAGGRVLPGQSDLLGMLKVCGALRDHVKSLIKANLRSWESGDGN